MTGDALAHQLLRHQNLYMGYLIAMTRNRDAAEEIFQNVVVVVLREGPKQTIRDFGAWTKEIVRRQALYYLRQKSRNALKVRPTNPTLLDGLSLVLGEAELDEELASREERALRECVRKLPERSREMVTLRYDQRQSFQEIAGAVGSSELAVQRALCRVRKMLHDCIQNKVLAAQEARS
ncbi:MAG TPA: sigma-70 family RNA polymerase sigma factor [Planctomycetota bacterium]|nr:sigma-70 family RNA polymerase sigma factor [Planctomycetota bacterium]